jgi:hypothetical protein
MMHRFRLRLRLLPIDRFAGLYPIKTGRMPNSKFDVGRWMFDLPAMPLGGPGRMYVYFALVAMIMQPSFIAHGRRVFIGFQGDPQGSTVPVRINTRI